MTGVDFSSVALAKARRLAAAKGVAVEWVLADLLAYEPPARAFDLVALLYLQLPATALGVVVRAAAAAVAAGGTLFVLGHDTTNLSEGIGGPKDAAVLYTPEEIVEALDSELVVERAEKVRRSVARPDREAFAIDALVCARRGSE